MTDIFDKCDFRETMKKYTKSISKDTSYEDSYLDVLGHEIFYGITPVDNGGPTMKSCDDSEWLQFSTNDYLGLSRNIQLKNIAIAFVMQNGIGTPMGSRLLTGNTQLHNELESSIADYKKTEAALTFSVGANAMMGAVSALATNSDMIIIDKFAHASLYCGAKISNAQINIFEHNDVNQLEDILKNAKPDQGKLIVVDGVYSMGGDIAPLREICDLKDKYNARLLVDDAHGNGVLGKNGRGVAELLEVEDRIDVHAGTFSKAFGSLGGFIASKRKVIDFMKFTSKTSLFTKAMPGVYSAVNLKAIDIVKNGYHLRQKISENTNYFQSKLKNLGVNIGDTVTPITPITFNNDSALSLSHMLRTDYKIWTAPVIYPAIPRGMSIIRIIPTAMHSKDQIDYFCNSFTEASKTLKSMNDHKEELVCQTSTAMIA